MSNDVNRPMRRVKRLSPLQLVGIEPQSEPVIGKWTQNNISVTDGDITLDVGIQVKGYEANGISDWYILGVKNGKLLITTMKCPTKVSLSGRGGYTNGIAILNEEASKFTNAIYADGNARTIDIDDINRVIRLNPEKAISYGKDTIWQVGFEANKIRQYGNEVTYYWDVKKSSLFCSGSNGATDYLSPHPKGFYYPTASGFTRFSKSTTDGREKEEITTIRNTAYSYSPIMLQNTSKAYRLLFKNKAYWVGSQYCTYRTHPRRVVFGLFYVDDEGGSSFSHFLSGEILADSTGKEESWSYGVLPVVSLKSDVNIDLDGNILK